MPKHTFNSKEELQAHICNFIKSKIDKDVKPEDHLIDDLGADSLEILMFSMQVKEEYDVPDIPEEDMEKMTHVKDIIDYVGKFTLKG